MKRIRFLWLWVAILAVHFWIFTASAAVDARWFFRDLGNVTQGLKTMTVVPLSLPAVYQSTNLLVVISKTLPTTAAGYCTISNLYVPTTGTNGASYLIKLEVPGKDTTYFTNTFPAGLTGYVVASSSPYISASVAIDSTTVAYSQAAADARFYLNSNPSNYVSTIGAALSNAILNGITMIGGWQFYTNGSTLTITNQAGFLSVLFGNSVTAPSFSGVGSLLTLINATNLSAGLVPSDRLSGVPFNGSGITNVNAATLGGYAISSIKDTNAIAYINSAAISDRVVQTSLDAFFSKAKTMANYSHFKNFWWLRTMYNPGAHLDLLGNTNITWVNEPPYGQFGARFNLTNLASFLVTATTNWTVVIIMQNPSADRNDTGGLTYPMKHVLSLENTNGDAITLSWNVTFSSTIAVNYGTVFPYNSNWNNSSPIYATGAKANDGYAHVLPPAMWTLSTSNQQWIDASYDTQPLYLSSGSVANFSASVTNFTPVNKICFGGSAKWNQSNPGWAAVNVQPTNGDNNILGVAFFDTKLSQSDLNIFYAAQYELRNKHHHIFGGDSMIEERVASIIAFLPSWTNCIPSFVMNYFYPNDEWSDYSQGNSTPDTMYANMNPRIVALRPLDADIVWLDDFPRNVILVTNTLNFASVYSNMNFKLAPFLTNGVRRIQYESVLPGTNAIFGTANQAGNPTNGTLRLNFVTGTQYGWSNTPAFKFVHGFAVWYGSVWDAGNNYYPSNAAGFSPTLGFHIEGSASPAFMYKMAVYIVTGEWPEIMPSPPYYK